MSNANEETAAGKMTVVPHEDYLSGSLVLTVNGRTVAIVDADDLNYEAEAARLCAAWNLTRELTTEQIERLTPADIQAALSGKAAADARVADLEAALKATLAGFEWHYTVGGSRHDDSSRRIIAEARKALPTPTRQI